MTRSPGFGSTARDYAPLSDSVSLRLPYTVKLATDSKSLTHYTKGTQSPLRASTACTYTVSGSIIQKVRRHSLRSSDCLYAHGFRIYFTPFTRVLFAFPSRYWFTIGRSGVFSLGGWSPHVQTGFLVPRPTHFSSIWPFRIQGCHLLWPVFPDCFTKATSTFGLLPVRSSLLRESRLISFPPGT